MIKTKIVSTKHFETIQDWIVANFCDKEDKNPNHCQFSAANVTDIIMTYEKDKLSGKIKLK